MEVFDKNPEMKSHLITNHGILPLITLLNNKNTVIINSVLRLITQVSHLLSFSYFSWNFLKNFSIQYVYQSTPFFILNKKHFPAKKSICISFDSYSQGDPKNQLFPEFS